MKLDIELDISYPHPEFFNARVSIAGPIIKKLYLETALAQQEQAQTYGFTRGSTPLEYIQTTYKTHIIDHLKEFILNYRVINFLYEELRQRKIPISGEVKLNSVEIDQDNDACFYFQGTLLEEIPLKGWKYYSFKPPKRKNYRDLDRQVEQFLKTEQDMLASLTQAAHTVHVSDWVCFDICIVDRGMNSIFPTCSQNLWLKIGNEEIDLPFQELFLGKKLGDSFTSSHQCLQEYYSNKIDTSYLFTITIRDIVSDKHFSLDDFKTHFRLRTNKEMHKKLIEVFSFRNDISQRRETVEEVFKVLLNQFEFQVPTHLVLRRQQALLATIHENPDYQVYRMQRDFDQHVKQLAYKQVQEIILIDQIAIRENIAVDHADIKNYLNLIKRPRTKEFIYFDPPLTKMNGQEVPIATELLKLHALREKTLNHLIFHLTRK